MSSSDTLFEAAPTAAPLIDGLPRLLAVGVVLLAAAAGVWFWTRRLRPLGRHLRIHDRLPVSRATSLVVVDVDDRRLLLSVSTDGARLIDRLHRDSPAEDAGSPEGDADVPAVSGHPFREVLRRLRAARQE